MKEGARRFALALGRSTLATECMSAADTAYKNAKNNSDKQNARIEHDKALARVIVGVMKV
jgi:type I restriction enzyme R subunit